MALTLYGIYNVAQFAYDEALNISRSLNIRLEAKPSGYTAVGHIIGINQEGRNQRRSRESGEDTGYHAPLLRKGSKLRLALPEERNPRRVQKPETEWDMLHGLILAYRQGDVPVARDYLERQAEGRQQVIMDLLSVWSAQMPDEKIRKEGEAIQFGMK